MGHMETEFRGWSAAVHWESFKTTHKSGFRSLGVVEGK